jgi:hypothetical protein
MSNGMIYRGVFACVAVVMVMVLGCSRAKPATSVTPASANIAASNSASIPAATPAAAPLTADQLQAQQDAEITADDTMNGLVGQVEDAIHKKHLTKEKGPCLSYDIDENADAYLVKVIETHAPGCGGDPNTSPRLFTVKVDKNSRAMTADNGSPGTFHPM